MAALAASRSLCADKVALLKARSKTRTVTLLYGTEDMPTLTKRDVPSIRSRRIGNQQATAGPRPDRLSALGSHDCLSTERDNVQTKVRVHREHCPIGYLQPVFEGDRLRGNLDGAVVLLCTMVDVGLTANLSEYEPISL